MLTDFYVSNLYPDFLTKEPPKGKLSPQAQKVLEALQKAGPHGLSQLEAYHSMDMSAATLSGRVWNLRQAGYKVRAERRTNPLNGGKYTRFFLEG